MNLHKHQLHLLEHWVIEQNMVSNY